MIFIDKVTLDTMSDYAKLVLSVSKKEHFLTLLFLAQMEGIN